MRERMLKVVLGLVGLVFCALVYAMVVFARREPALAMMMSIYATLGVFLLLAVRNPAANRTLIAFTAWSSLAHASLMAVQAWKHMIQNSEWMGVVVFGAIGVVLLGLMPKPEPREKSMKAAA